MKEFMNLISSDSAQSSGRFAFLFSIILSNVVVWYTWLFVCIWTRSIVDIPSGVVMVYSAAQGLSFAGKGIQTFAERSERPRYGTMMTPTAKSMQEVD